MSGSDIGTCPGQTSKLGPVHVGVIDLAPREPAPPETRRRPSRTGRGSSSYRIGDQQFVDHWLYADGRWQFVLLLQRPRRACGL